jgi:hypothetical protein
MFTQLFAVLSTAVVVVRGSPVNAVSVVEGVRPWRWTLFLFRLYLVIATLADIFSSPLSFLTPSASCILPQPLSLRWSKPHRRLQRFRNPLLVPSLRSTDRADYLLPMLLCQSLFSISLPVHRLSASPRCDNSSPPCFASQDNAGALIASPAGFNDISDPTCPAFNTGTCSVIATTSSRPPATATASSVVVPPSTTPSVPPTLVGRRIHPNGNGGKCLDVRGAVYANGLVRNYRVLSAVCLEGWAASQTTIPLYRAWQKKNAKLIALDAFVGYCSTPVQIYDCNGTPAQNWVWNEASTKVQLANSSKSSRFPSLLRQPILPSLSIRRLLYPSIL